MQINREFVVALRTRKSWSQAELAIAAGLNLRTIQRIEAEGVASLQSRKAIASAFDVEIDELVQRKVPAMAKYEYKQVVLKRKGLMMQVPDVASVLNKEGEQGWRLRGIVSPDDGGLGRIVAVLERERS
jgi:transcriptional regulator with XRE-family HTH domain